MKTITVFSIALLFISVMACREANKTESQGMNLDTVQDAKEAQYYDSSKTPFSVSEFIARDSSYLMITDLDRIEGAMESSNEPQLIPTEKEIEKQLKTKSSK